MIFAILTFLSALLIEGIGTYVSIIGLSSLFSSNPVIIMLALALDMGKLVTVSFLYKHWKKINIVMKTYMTVAATILMIITSAGAAGYLSAEFQQAIVSTKESDIIVAALKEEKVKLEARKKEIDAQIANLPPNMVKGRQRLINEFKDEISATNKRIVEIDKELPIIEVKKAHADSHAGPILYIAKAFNVTVEEAVKYVILLIIFVFDPLAVVLIIGGNFLVDQHRREQNEKRRLAWEREEEDRKHKHQIELDEIKHRHEIEEEQVEIEKLHHLMTVPVVSKVVEETITKVEEPVIEEPVAVTEEPIVEAIEEPVTVEPVIIEELVQIEEPTIESVEIEEPEPSITTEEQLETIIEETNIEVEPANDSVVPHEEPEVISYGESTSLNDIDGTRADVVVEGDYSWHESPPPSALKIYQKD